MSQMSEIVKSLKEECLEMFLSVRVFAAIVKF